jgi:hypothetical protein
MSVKFHCQLPLPVSLTTKYQGGHFFHVGEVFSKKRGEEKGRGRGEREEGEKRKRKKGKKEKRRGKDAIILIILL